MVNAKFVIIVLIIALFVGLICRFISNLNPIRTTPLIFIHIPKTAGTTIQQIGLENGYDWMHRELPNEVCFCNLHHIPPTERIKLSHKPIFTVIRNPYSRIISHYRYVCFNPTPEGLNEFIKEYLSSGWTTVQDCHWVPQYKYTQYADHILKYENLEEEFNNLMIKYNLPARMNRHMNIGNGQKLSIDNISSENIALINHNYREDFELGGYEMK